MDEIDCLQVEIIELEQRIITLRKLVETKLQNLEKPQSKSHSHDCDREKKDNEYVNRLVFS
jgi:hypothetical protein